MSGHAETIRTALTFTDAHSERYALLALDALLAENQRLREALVAMRELASVSLEDPWYAEQAELDSSAIFKQAREALRSEQ